MASDKIWLLPEETPLKEMKAQVLQSNGKVVLEKAFHSSQEGWWIDISALPQGQYQLVLSSGQREYFEKHPRKRTI